jgi:hypothetical protein
LYNKWSKEGSRYMICEVGRLELGQGLKFGQENMVLKSPK